MQPAKLEAIGVVPGRHGFVHISRGPGELDPHAVDCDVLAVGCCATDVLVMSGRYGEPPPGCDDLVTGHEVVVRVRTVPGDAVSDIDMNG